MNLNLQGRVMEKTEIQEFCKALKKKYKEAGTTTIIQREFFSPNGCTKEPQKLFVFGDNTMRTGNGGQACIRYCLNSYGIATKRAPGISDWDYFDDSISTLGVIFNDISNLVHQCKLRNTGFLVFPAAGLGSGLSEMPTRCPESYKILNECLDYIFGTQYNNLGE